MIEWTTCRPSICEMSLDVPPTVCLIVGAIVWGTWKEWGQLFTQMVYWWRCEAGQLTVGTQRLLFLVSLTVFKTTVFFSPPALSGFVCSGWHVWLFIVREKGVAGAINMWLHCILFSTEKAVSFNRYLRQSWSLLFGEFDWAKGGSKALISVSVTRICVCCKWNLSTDKYFFWMAALGFFVLFLSVNLFWHLIIVLCVFVEELFMPAL